MTDPTRYTRGYSFSGFQASNPAKSLPGTSLDNELENVEAAVAALADEIDLINGGSFVDSKVGASQPQAEQGVDNARAMTALRTKQAIDYQRPRADQTLAEAGADATAVMSPLTTKQAIVKQRGYVSVADFGAVGDGSTDDTTAFQNAIKATPNGTYVCIHIPRPTVLYNIAGTLTFGSRIILWIEEKPESVTDGKLPGSVFQPRGGLKIKLPTGSVGNGAIFEVTKTPSPLNFAANTRAALVVQQQDTQSLSTGQITPNVAFDFEVNADGFVNAGAGLSTSVWTGLSVGMRKTGNASAATYTATGSLGATAAAGYNELGAYMAEITNIGSLNGNLSGVEMLLKDSPDAGTTSYATRLKAVIGRVAKYNVNVLQCAAFLSSSEGSQPLDAILTTALGEPGSYYRGIDFTRANFTSGQAITLKNSTNISWITGGGGLAAALFLDGADLFNIGFGGYNTLFGGQVRLPAGTTARASLNVASGVAPTTPVNGDIWFDGTNWKTRVGGVTKTFTIA